MFYCTMMHPIAIMTVLGGVFVYVTTQTVYIDVDTGKVVGIQPGKASQGNYGNWQNRNQERQRLQYPQPLYPNQQRPHYQPQPPYYEPQPPQHQGGQTNTLNTEWVCTDPKTGNTMIIASENGRTQGPMTTIPNRQNPYPDNPWLQPKNPQVLQPNREDPQNNWNGPGQGMPDRITEPTLPPIILTTTPTPQTTASPSTSKTKAPFPSLDNIDWTQFLDQTTEKPSSGRLSAAIDGEGVLEPRNGGR